LLTIDYNIVVNGLVVKMRQKINKECIIQFYIELLKNSIDNTYTPTVLKKELKKIMLKRKDFRKIINELTKETNTKKYTLYMNETEKIISLISSQDTNIKIEAKIYDNEPPIYYTKNTNIYLINYDSIEQKWYLSSLNKDSLELIKEIYNDSYPNFIEYLKNKSH
jgi:hypothetical protein